MTERRRREDIREVIAAAAARVAGARNQESVTTWLKPWRFPPVGSPDLERDGEQRIVFVMAGALGTILSDEDVALLPPRVLESLKQREAKLRLPLAYLRELVARSRSVTYTVEPQGLRVTSASRGVEDLIPEVTRPIVGRPIWFLASRVESRFLSPEHRAQFVRTQDDIVERAKEGKAAFPDVVLFLRNENVRREEWRGLCRIEVHAEPVFGERGELVERLITVRIEREQRTESELKAVDAYKLFQENILDSTVRAVNGNLSAKISHQPSSIPPEDDVAEREALAAITGRVEELRREDPLVENLRQLKRETRLGLVTTLLELLTEEEQLSVAVQLGWKVEEFLNKHPDLQGKNPVFAAAMKLRGKKIGTAGLSNLTPEQRSARARAGAEARIKKYGR